MKKNNYFRKKRKNEFDELFHQEVETSERLRTGILIGLLGLEGVFLLILYLFYNKEYLKLFTTHIAIYAVLIFMAIIIIYELILHYYRSHCRKLIRYTSAFSGYLNVFFEVSLLSLLLIFIIKYSEQVIILHTPAALTYFIFIILSTLRLDFKLAMFTGLLSALEYILISIFFYNYSDRKSVV